MHGMENVKFPILQKIELAMLIGGGFFNIFEYNQWAAGIFSCIFYILASILHLIFMVVTKNMNTGGLIFYIVPILISFIRAERLHLKTNGYYFGGKWLRGLFHKSDSKNIDAKIEEQTNINSLSTDTPESIQEQINECLQNMGNSYVNLFEEEFYIQPLLLKARIVDDDTNEFVFKLDTEEQTKYLLSKEHTLNENMDYIHKFTILSDNIISLVVTPKSSTTD